MKIQLTYDCVHRWLSIIHPYDNLKISVIGSAFYEGSLLKEESLAKYFTTCTNENLFANQLKLLSGHFAVVMETNEFVYAAVDRIRTFPLFIFNSTDFTLTDTIIPSEDWNESQFPVFKKIYCTSENETLIKGCYGLMGGEYISINKSNNSYSIKTYYRHIRSETATENKIVPFEKNMIDHAIRYAEGRKILIPLSGGYDSRYLLALLKEQNYKDIECFTYGRKDSHEVLIAKNVAEKLNIKWHFIEYTDELLSAFFTSDWEYYSAGNHHYTSLPHEQDFFALLFMKQNGLLTEDTVIMNGFCQDIHAGSYIENVHKFDLQKFIQYKHLLRLNVNSYENSWDGYQEWLVKNRLSKFIINSVHVYEYFGLDFYLPFWDKDWNDFWYNLPMHDKEHQQLFTTHLFNGIFKKYRIDFRKPVDYFYSVKKIAKILLPKVIKEQWQQQNDMNKERDPNNTLYLYESILDRLQTKPAAKDNKINNIHALYLLEKLQAAVSKQ